MSKIRFPSSIIPFGLALVGLLANATPKFKARKTPFAQFYTLRYKLFVQYSNRHASRNSHWRKLRSKIR
jgi:hypothetical protein